MIILASASLTRQRLLSQLGLSFRAVASPEDEQDLHERFRTLNPRELAGQLALSKAQAVSEFYPQDTVIGCDQTAELAGIVLHKPNSVSEAHAQLLLMRGKTHVLHAAFAIRRNGRTLAQHASTAYLTMRNFSDAWLASYLGGLDHDVLRSVGCYQVEGPGLLLFEKIDGDHFTILGLPLLPLLASLREMGELAA
jgi:septum formation protein